MKISSSYVLAVGAIVLIVVVGAHITTSVGVAQDAPTSPPQSTAEVQIEGSVSKVVDVPGYTYVQVETVEGTVWAAAPSVSVKAGDTVAFATGMEMHDFYSKTLEREFEVIYFVDRFISNDGASSIDNEAAAAHGSMGAQQAVAPVEGISKADGGHTIAEIFAGGGELSGKTMRVRGQVVKFTGGVMGTNWLRIRDGSIENDLIIPSDVTVAIGAVVLAEGRLVINMDLGQGYVLPAVLEDAEVTIEK
jgi:hypothetical protein